VAKIMLQMQREVPLRNKSQELLEEKEKLKERKAEKERMKPIAATKLCRAKTRVLPCSS
tara:strand:- start:1652 stop:1828 length:177 start_codon:yes stop_codon:yes gene_type:complete